MKTNKYRQGKLAQLQFHHGVLALNEINYVVCMPRRSSLEANLRSLLSSGANSNVCYECTVGDFLVIRALSHISVILHPHLSLSIDEVKSGLARQTPH
eukprot:scaffold30760_cov168-Skeletonema_marinoi.AAC.2